MLSARALLFLALGLVTIGFACLWTAHLLRGARATPATADQRVRRPTVFETMVGFVTNFFDTLGIGSFASTTSIYRLFRLVPDENIPGTLNVGHTVPTVVEALIFIAIVAMDMRTLILMIGASVVGAWLGAGVVASWPRRNIQIGMGIALVAAAVFFLMSNLGLFPLGGDALGLAGPRLAVAVAVNCFLGALMTLGIGAYAPCMILTSLLGMNPKTAFPVMMGSCAFLMPAASIRFIAKGRYSPGPALGLALGGVPAVLIAALLVKSLPLTAIRWLVIGVVLYTAATMLHTALSSSPQPALQTGGSRNA